MKVTVKKVENIAKNIKMFWFEPERSLSYTAGQFVELIVPHDKPDNRGIKRWFTLSSSPSEDLVAITTKFPDKPSSFKQALQSLKSGDSANMSEPMGDFVLPKNKQTQLVFIAGGIGITPFRSMCKWLQDNNLERSISMFYGVGQQDEVAYQEILANNTNLNIVYKNPPSKWSGLNGYVNADMIMQQSTSKDSLYFIAGPEPMVESLVNDLQEKGVAKKNIVGDYFPGYS